MLIECSHGESEPLNNNNEKKKKKRRKKEEDNLQALTFLFPFFFLIFYQQ